MEVVPPRGHATTQVEALIEEGNGAPLRGLEGFPLGDLLGDRLRDQLADGSPPLGREDLRLPDGLPIETDCQVLLGLHGEHTGPGGTWHTCSTWIACRPISELGRVRPGIVVSNSIQNERLDSVVIVPLSSRAPEIWLLRFRVEPPGMKASYAVIPGIRQVSKSRLEDFIAETAA
jgi:mRNA-degrading endonuclease toxin of MazEF toxin-antitoxin module